jgi:hypothetical protein
MSSKRHCITGLSLALVAGAIAVAPASARLDDGSQHRAAPATQVSGVPLRPGTSDFRPRSPVSAPQASNGVGGSPTSAPIAVTPNNGLDWADVGIGAGAGFALAMISVGGALAISSHRRRRTADARPAATA